MQRTEGFELAQRKILPPDLHASAVADEHERVIEILRKFLEACERFRVFASSLKSDEDITEEVLEDYRSTFNRIQSLYDSYLRKTDIEQKLNLPKIRGHASVPLHLLEIGRALIHFYERHSDRIRQHPSAMKIATLVSKNRIRANVKEFVIKDTLNFVTRGKEVCAGIFDGLGIDSEEYVLDTKVLIIPAYRMEDFHIRPVMPITQIAAKYATDSFLYFNRNKYNIKSAIEMAIAIPDVRETLSEGNAALMIQGPRKGVNSMYEFLKEKCGAYEKEVGRDTLETQSARLDKAGKRS